MVAKKKVVKEEVAIEEPVIEFAITEPKREIPLWERDDLVFEKKCPECNTNNYTMETTDRTKGYASIWFTCKKCQNRYRHWWYGTGPSDGNEPTWRGLLRKSFQVICTHADKGITIEHIYYAFESLGDSNAFVIIENDESNKNVEYPKEYFIADNSKEDC